MALLSLLPSACLRAQSAAALAQVKKIYVEPFGGKRGAHEIRQEVVERLKHDTTLSIVSSAAQADAVLKGNGEIWATGYIGTNPRDPEGSRSPVYSGYLSLTLEGGDAQPLWSYLVTPGGSLAGAITSKLADHGVKLLLAAVARERDVSRIGANPALGTAVSQKSPQETLKGAGGTFPAPLYQAWIESFHDLHPEIEVSYAAVGSERGVQRLLDGRTDFAASDVPTSPPGANLQRFATVLGAVVPICNVNGLGRRVRFTSEILSGIYLGKITRWNDPQLRAFNKGLDLPNASIAVVHRSDGSGTTYAFTDFLSETSPEWKAAVGVGSTVSWPAGKGAVGNEGVATEVQQTPNAIGYVELTYAIQRELSFGSVRNAAGVFVTANLESVADAAQSERSAHEAAPSITDAPGKSSYPISSLTWIVLPTPVSAKKRTAILQLLHWMLSTGQKQCSALGYAPLPRDLASRELESLHQLK